jgi:hypothetical protein
MAYRSGIQGLLSGVTHGHDLRQTGMSDLVDTGTFRVLARYSAGEVSSREAAKEPGVDQHCILAGMIEAGLPLPVSPANELAGEFASLHHLYGTR